MNYIDYLRRLALMAALIPGIFVAAQDRAEPQASAAANVSPTAAATAVADTYQIGAGDVLAINVWKEAELSRVLPVRPDGKLSLPLIGEIDVTGLTAAQLQADLAQRYRKFVTNPEVTVMVQEAHSRRFNVVGKVQHPGTFTLTQPTTVLEALALVGGFVPFAKTKDIYVLRAKDKTTAVRIPFNYTKVIKGKDQQENILLESGDTVVVP